MMKKTALLKKSLFGAIAAFFTVIAASASYNSYGIPDSAEIRKNLIENWFEAPVDMVRTKDNEIYKNAVNQSFQVSFQEQDNYLLVMVIPASQIEVEYQKDQIKESRLEQVYSPGAAGSWILFRNGQTGQPEKLHWYFNADSQVYLEFTAAANKTFADLIVYNNYVVKHTPVGVPFQRLYTSSFQEIQNWTNKSIPWYKVQVIPGQYRELLQTAYTVRKYLPKIQILDKGYYNEDGVLCNRSNDKPYILLNEDLEPYSAEKAGILQVDSAGFIKWIADGLIFPYTGSYTTADSLYNPTVEYNPLGKTGIKNQQYDIAFSLNWTRNLALQAWNVRNRKQVKYEDSGIDVNYNHFTKVSPYIKDTGYKVQLLKSILYIQAVIEPGYAYFGAVKEYSVTKPEEFVFNNQVAFFPYFDDNGHFDCLVFEAGQEMTLDGFISKYRNSFVNLVRIKTSEDFYPLENF